MQNFAQRVYRLCDKQADELPGFSPLIRYPHKNKYRPVVQSWLFFRPVKAMTKAPLRLATFTPARTFGDEPLVDIAQKMSPFLTSASACLANTFS